MSTWKKALSVTASAALLASLLATAVVGTALANTNSLLNVSTTGCAPTSCTQVAGSGYIQVAGSGNGTAVAPQSGAPVMFLVSGGTFVGADGTTFQYNASAIPPAGSGLPNYPAGSVQLLTATASTTGFVQVSASVAGTATITEYVWSTTNNTWLADGNTYALTFTSSSNLQVSAANSSVAIYAIGLCTGSTVSSGAASPAASRANLCVTVKDGNAALVTNASVTATITPVGLVNGVQSATALTAAGVAQFDIESSNVPGTATISVSVTFLGVTTALPSATFTFTGTPNSLAITNYNAFTGTGGATTDHAFLVKSTDASGNTTELAFATAGLTFASTPAGLVFSAGTATSTHPNNIAVACPAGTTEQAYTVTATLASPSLTTPTPAKFYCNTQKAAKIVIAANTSTLPAGGSTAVTVKVTDAAGNPVPDGTVILGVASAGALLGDGTSGTQGASTLGGEGGFTYFAQNTTGTVTISFIEPVTTGLTAQGQLTIGAGSALTITTATKLNLPTASPSTYSTSTKVASSGQYVTWRGYAGTGNAGKTVVVWQATKNSSGTWGSWVKVTTRVADSNGVVLYYQRNSSAKWISVRFQGPAGNYGNAVQARWQ